ncbi:site-specific integrase [uncultured Lamprocystis sp.]|jgi:integrase|uniref:tyrosine-type recombinase/integrase n=1 Tax=uncultured Lamprocystis sp. TaxID=543132 RepID=UPI0025DFCAC3|nr:site-specific integrase [uncultured Lamprocystis sp.]
MATLTKRTDSTGAPSYRVEVRLKGYPAQRATFERKTDARKWASATETAIREGRHFGTVEAKRHTLADLIDRYTRDVLPTKKAKTQGPQATQLAWWKDQIGARTLADVTPALIAEYRDTLSREPVPSMAKDQAKAGPERTRSPATVNRYLAALSHCFTVAVKEWGWIEFNPLLKVTKPKEPRGRVRFLSDDERERFLTACRGSSNKDLYPAVILALSTGARQQEIMSLRWPQVDLARRVATLHETKNGEIRVLPLAGPALDLLRERSKVRRLDTDLIFPGHTRPAKPIDLRTPFETALKRAEIADFRWHDLRHTAASYLAMNGASLAEIAEVLGHKTLSMVKRYAHLSEAHTASVVERMNARYFGEGAK